MGTHARLPPRPPALLPGGWLRRPAGEGEGVGQVQHHRAGQQPWPVHRSSERQFHARQQERAGLLR
eukprot:6769018-Alexandrium_andersonii.AAC.1